MTKKSVRSSVDDQTICLGKPDMKPIPVREWVRLHTLVDQIVAETELDQEKAREIVRDAMIDGVLAVIARPGGSSASRRKNAKHQHVRLSPTDLERCVADFNKDTIRIGADRFIDVEVDRASVSSDVQEDWRKRRGDHEDWVTVERMAFDLIIKAFVAGNPFKSMAELFRKLEESKSIKKIKDQKTFTGRLGEVFKKYTDLAKARAEEDQRKRNLIPTKETHARPKDVRYGK